MALPTGLGQRALQSLNRPSALQFIGAPQVNAPATQPVPQNIMGLRKNVLAQQMLPQLTPAQQFRQLAGMSAAERLGQQRPSIPSAPPKAPTGMQGLLSGLMPEAGTPEMAGYGAAGQKLLELSGYRAVPITIGEALGQAAGAYGEARGAALQQQKEEQAAQAAAERQARLDAMAAEKQAQEARLSEARIYEIYNKSPDETTLIQNLKAAGIEPSSEQGRQIIVDYLTKKGGTDVSVTLGDGAQPLDKANIKAIQMEYIKGTRTLDTLEEIKASYRPEFQQIPTRINNLWLSGKEKLGANLSGDEVKQLQDFSIYRQNAINAVNNYIRDITGAQMSVAEAERLAKALPQPGVGIFDGDSPTVFKAKLDNAIRQIELIRQRNAYFLAKGIEPTFDYRQREFGSDYDVPALRGGSVITNVSYKLGGGRTVNATEYDIKKLKMEEGQRLMEQYKDMPVEQRKEKVKTELAVMFGLVNL